MGTCSGGGWIVGTDEPLGYYPEGGTFCGCDRLKCPRCGEFVRHFDGVQFAAITLGRDGSAKLFASNDPLAFPDAEADRLGRVYVCACSFEQTRGGRSMDSLENSNWSCAGHSP